MRKTPKRVSGIGALSEALKLNPSTVRVSAGSMTPSSHKRALAKYGLPSASNLEQHRYHVSDTPGRFSMFLTLHTEICPAMQLKQTYCV